MWLLYAFLSAISFGFRGILYQWTSRMPIDRNLLLLGVYLSGAIITITLALATGAQWTAANAVGILMGVLSFVSNGSMYRAFAVGKASLVAILTGLTPVVVVVVAYFAFGETLNFWQSVSFFVILAGIIMIRYSNDLSLKNLKGVYWGLLAMLTFGLTDVAGKWAMVLEADVYPTLVGMFSTGSVLFTLFWLNNRQKPLQFGTKQTPAQWSIPRTLLLGMAVGLTNITGMICLLIAFSLGITGLVSAVAALNVLIIILYARIFLKEKFTRMEATGMAVAFAGIVLLRLMG